MEKGSDIQSYFEEIAAALIDLRDSEDDSRALLAKNALEEISGQELTAAISPGTAFTLEKLLKEADLLDVLSFLQAVLATDDAFGKMSSDSTGSYIVEQILQKVAAQQEDADAVTKTAARQVLNGCCDAIVDSLEACITDRCASHVARQLLSTAAGRDVSPPAGKAKIQPSVLFDDEDDGDKSSRASAKEGKAVCLAGRLGGGALKRSPEPFPEVIAKMTSAALDDDSARQLADLAYDAHASPFLQALIEANANNGKSCEQLVACMMGTTRLGDGSFSAASIAPAAIHDMMNDRTGSHVMEATFKAAHPELFNRLWDRALRGKLAGLASHPCANFALSAALRNAPDATVIKDAIVELQDSFSDLLGRNRSGVIASIFAAAARLKAGQSEACRALSRGLTALPAADTNKRGLAVALLTLDGTGQLGGGSVSQGAESAMGLPKRKPGRLSSTGCAILELLLRFPLDASQKFAKAVSTLSPEDAAVIGGDGGGSRVLEAFIRGPASTKQKKALLQQLRGSWAAVAVTLPGSHLVQTCHDFAGGKAREDLVAELAEGRKALYTTRRGPQVIQLTGADLYARSPAEWRARAETASDVRAQFAEILEDDVRGTGTGGTPRGASKFTSVAADAMSQPKKRKKQNTGLSDASPTKASETKGGAAGVASARKHVAKVDPLSSDSLRKPRKASKQKDSLQIYKSKADDLTTEPAMSMPGKPKKHKIAGAIVGGGLTEQVVEQDRKHNGQDGLTDRSALTTSRCTGASLAPKRKKTKVKGGGGKRVDDVKTLYQLLSA